MDRHSPLPARRQGPRHPAGSADSRGFAGSRRVLPRVLNAPGLRELLEACAKMISL
ncbi:hypothetical protein Salmuc_03099 [Salipiger mucosus DSM 16094]|uniref:Uncharacterized protein n=1 Tax=Salipiger mucosus DSM 16094 TaxID=1123237 RepID=S9Q6Z7_9RHOB|nr:hypothetical protein Salmuc_03099 [Salipiger mucosus DSM 16094]